MDEFFWSQTLYSDTEIRKLYSSRIVHNQNVTVENQSWFGTFFDANDEIINELDQDWLVSKTVNSAYVDLGLASTDSVALRLQNQSFTTTVVPIKTFTTGLQSSDPGTQTHGLGCTPKDFFVLHEGASIAGDFDKRYDLCSADDINITCDLSSLTIDATHRVAIEGSCAPIAIALDIPTSSQMLIQQNKSSGNINVAAGQSLYRPNVEIQTGHVYCLLYTSPSPRD